MVDRIVTKIANVFILLGLWTLILSGIESVTFTCFGIILGAWIFTFNRRYLPYYRGDI